ncbi:adenine nucleotide alpha hydrolase family protein [Burkholderia multivorans]|uniref:hypothetical protein n=1 Tax=Burkholderia multivorans TaxID=87883 RepID=UPI000CFEC892|nr:hypothetical protein [Burkholderia multivorans]MBU9185204.1 hypothetical protein [Burkholderia multivorans]PRE23721.1 hypothetical protein C6P79_21230 [Burkholderia multivorans]
MKQQAAARADSPSAFFRVADRRVRKSAKVHVVRLGDDIKVRPDRLSAYCFRQSDGLAHDLMTLIGAVKYADRKLMRHHSKGWERYLHIELPVFRLNIWLQQSVQDSLVHCLNYLTGDIWSFSFTERTGRPPTLGQSPLSGISLSNRDLLFVPFSHGLDSYGQVRLWQCEHPDTEVVCVFADARISGVDHGDGLNRRTSEHIQYVRVPVSVKPMRRAEPSFRSRPFMFYLLAGLGAIESGANKVMIPENGQGSIGGSLIVTGHEAKHRSCYPGFTAKLSRFVEALTGKRVKFYHPALFKTKGAVLRALADVGEDVRAVLARHSSCSCDARLTSRDGRMFHCGLCGNCLLRRAAEHSVDLDGTTEYLFEDLSAGTLESALRSGNGEVKMRFFHDLARNGARDMQRLADLVSASSGSAAQVAAIDLARFVDGGIEYATSSLSRLLNCHAAEWGEFLSACGENSWISRTARG